MQDFRMQTFLAVCRHLNFTKAAKELNLTQPAVSQHIRYLEKAYDAQLFFHVGKKIGLTEAGEILKNAALAMEHDEQHMKIQMQQTKCGVQRYSFGVTLSVAEFMIAEDLKSFIRKHPKSHIQMQVHNTSQLLKKLDANEIDFAIVEGEFPKDEYEYLPYRKEEYIAAAVPEKAERYKNCSVFDLCGETILLREQGSGTREILQRWLSEKGMNLECFSEKAELGSIGAINYLLKSGIGITFCYRTVIRKEEETGELAVIPMQDLPIVHEVMFLFRKNSIFKEDYMEIYRQLCRKE